MQGFCEKICVSSNRLDSPKDLERKKKGSGNVFLYWYLPVHACKDPFKEM